MNFTRLFGIALIMIGAFILGFSTAMDFMTN